MSKHLQKAILEWQSHEHYDAHETLEDFADEVEDHDEDWRRALALWHVAASIHKYLHTGSPKAVPGKLEKARIVLDSTPDDWFGIDIRALREEVIAMRQCLIKGETPVSMPQLKVIHPNQDTNSR